MRCINPNCREPVEDGAAFCPFCAAPQSAPDPQDSQEPSQERLATVGASASQGGHTGLGSPAASTGGTAWADGPPRPSHGAGPGATATLDPPAPSPAAPPVEDSRLLLRASESIWPFEEPEGEIPPGKRRPLLIVDEQTTHLAHTDRTLTPGELLARTRAILEAQEVPVNVEETVVFWLRDRVESRPRLVATLAHRKTDIKMIFGVDYLGKWASIQMHVGIEPDPAPVLPPPPQPPAWKVPIDGVIALVLGVLTLMIFVGIFGIAYGAWRLYTSYTQHQERTRMDREGFVERQREEAARRARERAAERLARTFKVDDARLFCAAMQVVFQSVVDDIVQKGGEVVRVQGGQGGYFDAAGLSHPAPSARVSDAAQSEV